MDTCRWTRGRAIGRGSSATVWLAMAHSSDELFAVKSAELACSNFLQREQRILSLLDCPRIVACVGHGITTENDRQFFNLLMEYVDGGTLSDAIRQGGGRLEEPMIQSHTRAILEGLVYLHSKGLVHCDIKGRNVLIGSDGAKIADLGCARWVDVPGPIAGTPLFMSPEVARGEEQGFPADVWALGCTVVEMATGCAPWPDTADPVSALFQIANSGKLPEFPSWLSEQGKDFLSKCLKRNPNERWTADQLLKHPFVDESNSLPKQVSDSVPTNSPKSILDLAFWDSLAETQVEMDPTHFESSGNSPADRIRQLSNSIPARPNWTWDEHWVTVRSSEEFQIEERQIPANEHLGGSDSPQDRQEGSSNSTRLAISGSDLSRDLVNDSWGIEWNSESNGHDSSFQLVLDDSCKCNEDIVVSSSDTDLGNLKSFLFSLFLIAISSKLALFLVLRKFRRGIIFELYQQSSTT